MRVKAVEIEDAVEEFGGTREKRRARLLASWGWRDVLVALSRKAP